MKHTHAQVAVALGILLGSSVWKAEGWLFGGSSSSSSSRPSTPVFGNSRRSSFPWHSSTNTFSSRLSSLGSRNPLSTRSRSSSFSLSNPLPTSNRFSSSILKNPLPTSNRFSSSILRNPLPTSNRFSSSILSNPLPTSNRFSSSVLSNPLPISNRFSSSILNNPLPTSGRFSSFNSGNVLSSSSSRHSQILVPRVKPKISGDIGNLNPTGASSDTARSDRLSYTGVRASRQMARNDLSRINNYKSNIIKAARNYNMDPAVVAGVISRESRGGSALSSTGTGDHGNGFGLMQVDKRHHSTKGGAYSVEHLNQGTKILADNLKAVKAKHPNWSPDQQLQGAIAAYNFGVDDVRSLKGLDRGSTNDDYSNDVVARAKFYRENGFRKE